MSTRINNNITAMNSLRNMSILSGQKAKAMEKLSSGQAINRAADNAAGLAISEKMRGQIRGLDQASANSQDAISLIQTAEGALNETHSILQRMRELAVQAANDTNTDSDRAEIQKEADQLTSEINRIGNTTEFNTKKLMNGTLSSHAAAAGTYQGTGIAAHAATAGVYQGAAVTTPLTVTDGSDDELAITVDGTSVTADLVTGDTTFNTVDDLATAMQTSINAALDAEGSGTAHVTVTVGSGNTLVITSGSTGAASGVTIGAGSADEAAMGLDTGTATGGTAASEIRYTVTNGSDDQLAVTVDGTSVTADLVGANTTFTTVASLATAMQTSINAALDAEGSGTAHVTVAVGTGNSLLITSGTTGATSSVTIGAASANEASIGLSAGTATGGVDAYDGRLNMQIGANNGQTMTIDVQDMRSKALGIAGTAGTAATVAGASFTSGNTVTDGTTSTTVEASLDLSDSDKATAAIEVIDDAITTVSGERSKLGAYQNRLEHTINNLDVAAENIQSAESRIRDVDMAEAVLESTRVSTLGQAAQAMLAQANQEPQQVLQLLQ